MKLRRILGSLLLTARRLPPRPVLALTDCLSRQAQMAIAGVVEAERPLCHFDLWLHEGRGCRTCCGDSHVVDADRLDIRACSEYGRNCTHWEAVWNQRRGFASS